MELGLRGKAAVVTGGSRGIGKAVALSLLQEGCAVAICARNPERLHAAVGELSQTGGRIIGVPTDVADEAAVHRFVGAALQAFGRIDVLVNNAARTCVAPSRARPRPSSSSSFATSCSAFSR